ncbi:MAG: sulfatase-like hydrolase/transferase [Nonlabens sp.]
MGKAQEKPNIIVIYIDDLGYADIDIQVFREDVETPHIETLAFDDVRMNSGYLTATHCIPSRAGILTGKYQQKFGLNKNGTIPLPIEEQIIPQYLKNEKYVTGMAGNWHFNPNQTSKEWTKLKFMLHIACLLISA